MPPLFERHPRRYREHLFDDLPVRLRQEAQRRLWLMRQDYKEEHGSVPAYAASILIGRSRAITVAGPGERSRIGRRMLAARGGHALQRELREAGLTGHQHPYCQKAREAKARRAMERKQAIGNEGAPLPTDSLGMGIASLARRRASEGTELPQSVWEATSAEKRRSKWLLD